MQVRELKHNIFDELPDFMKVAPHAGAWIETPRCYSEADKGMSHLMQVRELKQIKIHVEKDESESHLMQVRELKLAPIILIGMFTRCRTSCRCVNWNIPAS